MIYTKLVEGRSHGELCGNDAHLYSEKDKKSSQQYIALIGQNNRRVGSSLQVFHLVA
jgi:hypothetical protein